MYVSKKDFVAQARQQELRDKLIQLWSKKLTDENLQGIASSIGIHRLTLGKFMNGGNLSFRALARIENYLAKDGNVI